MNTDLYNSLVNAYNFLNNDEKNARKVERQKNELWLCKADLNSNIPKYEEKKINWFVAWILICVFLPVGVLYIAIKVMKNKASRKKYDQEVKTLLNSPNEIEYRRQKQAAIINAELLLERYKKEKEEYFNANYQKCLGFLPECLRKKESIESLIHYVKTGQANTLDKAWSIYAKDLRDLDTLREQREEKELREYHYKEAQNTLDRIARNQEKINHELEVANKYRRGEYK